MSVEHSFDSPVFLFTDYETQGNEADKESIASVETTSLLQRLLPNSSPLSELQVFLCSVKILYRISLDLVYCSQILSLSKKEENSSIVIKTMKDKQIIKFKTSQEKTKREI